MAVGKEDYKDSQVREKRRIKVPKVTLAKVELDNDDKRTRAELLDSIEELFQNTYHAGRKLKYDKDVDLDSLKAILTMLVLSAANNSDDIIGATQAQVDAINLNAVNIGRNASDLATFISNISISNDKVGIGTTSPVAKLHIMPSTTIGWSSLGAAGILIGTNTGAGIGIDQNEIASRGDHLYLGTIDANKDLILRTGGATNRLVVKGDTGNVGIGTSSPSNPLTVVGSDSVGIDDYILHNDDGNTKFGFPSNDTFKVRTAGSDRFYINSSGNVGIGTTSPSTELQLGDGTTLQQLLLLGPNSATNSSEIILGDSTAVAGPNHAGVGIRYDSANNILTFRSFFSGVSQDVNMMALVRDSGNVGIGTATPSEKLEVNGNVQASSYKISGVTVLSGSANVSLGSSGATGTISLNTHTSTALYVAGDDNVGIGTTSPGKLLDVNGTFRASGEAFLLGGFDVTAGSRFRDGVAVNFNTNRTARIFTDTNDLIIQQGEDDKDIIFKSDDGSGGTTDYIRIDGGDESIKFYKDISNQANANLVMGGGQIKFSDAGRFYAGDSNDLQIYHNGTNSNIENFTGTLQIVQNADDGNIAFRSDDGSGGTTEYFRLDGALGYTRFWKHLRLEDNVELRVGTGNDLKIYHNGTNSTIENETGNLYILNDANDGDIVFQSDDGSGGTEAYFYLDGGNNNIVFQKDIVFVDNEKAIFGVGSDLQIYHDGSNSYIDDAGTGNLKIRSNRLQLEKYTGETMAEFIADGSSSLYYDNNKKFETTSTGVEVTGNISLTGSVQKQIQVFPMNFTDDLGTDKHFMPFVTNTEQTVNYQEEAAMVMPADGRVVSVTVHYAQMHGAASDITVGIETSPCGQSYTNAWTIEETETISASADDDHHVFHFAFDNAKHFESTDKMALSIQQSVDLQNASRFFWVTAVIEYDWSTFLGGTSAEYGTTP
jgi:hypothetical protein